MLFIGKIIEWMAGKALVPILLFGVAALTGWYVRQGRAIEAAREDGKRQCEQQWEVAVERQRRVTAEALVAAANKQLEATDILNMEMKADAARITKEIETYRVALAGADQRCLSDGVRDLARGVEGAGGREESDKPSRSIPVKRPQAPRHAK